MHRDLEGNLKADMLPIVMNGEREFAIAYPYRRHIRLFNTESCLSEPNDLIVFGEEGAGPMAMDLSDDGQTMAVALADPRDPCAPGALAVVQLPEGRITYRVELPIGASDVVLGNGPQGEVMLATMPGGNACEERRMAYLDLNRIQNEPERALFLIDLPTTGMHRITRTRDRAWAAFATGQRDTNGAPAGSGGRVGLIDLEIPMSSPTDP